MKNSSIDTQLREYRRHLDILDYVFDNLTEENSKGLEVTVYYATYAKKLIGTVVLRHSSTNRETISYCKQTFGKKLGTTTRLEEVLHDGKVSYLKGTLDVSFCPDANEGEFVQFSYYGSHECRIERTEEQTVEETVLPPSYTRTVTKRVPVYYCGPAAMPKN